MYQISDFTLKTLKKRKVKLQYSKQYKNKKEIRHLTVNKDYTDLRYYGVMRKYLQWKYNIGIEDLELLYYLMGSEFFTKVDFDHFPVRWGNRRLKNLIEKEMIDKVFPERTRKQVYRLSITAKIVVKMAHQLLSGQLKMPVDSIHNKSFRQKATYSQKRFRSIMEDMRECEIMKSEID